MSKYICNNCNYLTNNRTNFIKHCNTKKHMIKNKHILYNNSSFIYLECKGCNYITCSIVDMEKHSKMEGHVCKMINYNNKNNKSNKVYKCNNCNKIYKYHSGYYRHKQLCNMSNNNILKLLKHTTDINAELNKKINKLERSKGVVNNINTNITNNNLDIHFYLNNKCKNAMNISDFLDTIKLTFDDLLYTTNNGYIKGITNIFVKNLEHMPATERPIHSIRDKKNPQFYIKDESGWEYDKKDIQLDNTIESVSKKQCNKIKEWESRYPDWNETDDGINDYMKMVQSVLGGINENERILNKKKIKEELQHNTKIDILK